MDEVKAWLRENRLGDYCQAFEDNGWDEMSLLPEMSNTQIEKCIQKEGHIAKFKRALRTFQNNTDSVKGSSTESLEQKLFLNNPDIKSTHDSHEEERPFKVAAFKELEHIAEEVHASFSGKHTSADQDSTDEARQLDTMTMLETDENASKIILARENGHVQSTPNINYEEELSDTDSENNSWTTMKPGYESQSLVVPQVSNMPSGRQVSFTYISHSANTTINKEPTQIFTESKPTTAGEKNLKGQMETIAEWYEKSDRLYVETYATRECQEILEANHWVNILGKPGDGKSMMAAHLMLQYKKRGYEPVFLTSSQDWKALITCECKEAKQFAIIDDIFGSSYVDRRKVEEWLSCIENMEKIVAERDGNLVVVCTSRRHLFEDVKAAFAKSSSFTSLTILDLVSKSCTLTTEEKENIFQVHAVNNKVENYTKHDIGQLDPPHGFPHCVSMFCTNVFLRQDGLSFFKNPTLCIQKEIQNFEENDRVKYLVLLLVMLHNNKLEVDVLENLFYEVTKAHRNLFKAAGVSLDTSLPDIFKALSSLTRTYIQQRPNGSYCFTHGSLMENVAFFFAFSNPVLATEMLHLKFLLAFPQQTHDAQAVLTGSRLGPTTEICLQRGSIKPLVKRITKELREGNVFFVSSCNAWYDNTFVKEWIRYVTEEASDALESIFCTTTTVCDNLVIALTQLYKDNAVTVILNDKTVMDQLKHYPEWHDILQSGLEIACTQEHTVLLMEAFTSAQTGDTPYKLQGSKLLMDAIERSDDSCARVLLRGTDIDPKYTDASNNGYLHHLGRAKIKRDSYRRMFDELVKLGADYELQNADGKVPADIFMEERGLCMESTLTGPSPRYERPERFGGGGCIIL